MIEDEIIKHVPDAVGIAKVAAASIPFTAIVKRMLGPAADELAEMWKDQVRLYRYERQLKCVEKAEKMANDAGFTPQAVPPKILFPLLEGASFEDNEDMHTMWATMLTHAASPKDSGHVRPAFIAILKQMAPDEAHLLDLIDTHWSHYKPLFGQFTEEQIESVIRLRERNTYSIIKALLPEVSLEDPAEHLTTGELKTGLVMRRQQLFTTVRDLFLIRYSGDGRSKGEFHLMTCVTALENAGIVICDVDGLLLTPFGQLFLRACTPPKPNS